MKLVQVLTTVVLYSGFARFPGIMTVCEFTPINQIGKCLDDGRSRWYYYPIIIKLPSPISEAIYSLSL
jgi:hypothetical protein